MEKISRERFIRLGTALGVGAAGASLAACGGSASSGGDSASKESGGSSGGKKESGGGTQSKKESGGGSGDHGHSGDHSHGDHSHGKEGGSKQAASSSGGAAIASESEVAPGSAVTFKDAGNPAVLVHLDSGDFVAYSAICTHQGCTVAYKNGQLACPCHGSIFDPADGAAVVVGPATEPLPEIPVKVQGGDIVKG